MAEKVTLRDAMRSYATKTRANKATFAEGQGRKKILGAIGDEVIGAAKYYEKSIKPNIEAWKDIEAGYDELGIDEESRWGGESFEGKRPNFITRMKNPDRFDIPNIEAGYDELGIDEESRWGDGKAPNFIQRMKNPDRFDIPNIESGDNMYNVGGRRALGRASKTSNIDTYKALATSGETDFKSLFAMKTTESLDSVTKPKVSTNMNPAKLGYADASGTSGTIQEGGHVVAPSTNVTVPDKKIKLNNNIDTNADDNSPEIGTNPIALTYETDKEFQAWYKGQNSNTLFSSEETNDFAMNLKMTQAYEDYLKNVKGKKE